MVYLRAVARLCRARTRQLAACALACLATGLAAPAMAQSIVIATEPSASSAPLFIAADRGWFAEEGLDVSFLFLHAEHTVGMALVQQDADFALVRLNPTAFDLAAREGLRIVAGGERLDAEHMHYAWTAPGGGDVAPVQAGVIGVSEGGAFARYLLARLDDATIAPSPAGPEVVQLNSDVALAAAVVNGQVDLALLPARLAAPLSESGDSRIVAWAGSDRQDISLSMLMTTAAHVRLRGDLVERFLRAYLRGVAAYHDFVLSPADDDAAIADARRDATLAVIGRYIGQETVQVAAGLPYFDRQAVVNIVSLQDQLAWWQADGACAADIDLTPIVDVAPLRTAEAILARRAAEAEVREAAAIEAAEAAAAAEAASVEGDDFDFDHNAADWIPNL